MHIRKKMQTNALATPRVYFRFCISALVVLSVVYYWVLLSIGSYARITSPPGTLNGVNNIERTHLDKAKEMHAGLSDELSKHKNKHFIKPTQTKENLQALIDRLQDDLKEAQSRVKLFAGKEELLDDANRKIIEVSAKNENLLKEVTQLRNKEVTTQPFASLKIVHIDLKGAPPKIDYLIESMLLMKELGAQGFLMEYEDMFPWSDDVAVLAANDSYSMTDIKRIVDTAHKEHLVVIPLVPTFGHLEFALKHKAFRGLRENREMSNSVCPLNNATLPFLENLVRQVQKAHLHSKWLHLGGDEVWNIKTCDRCRQSKLTAAELFIQHMRSMAVFTKTLKSDDGEAVSPIIWDDMMRWWSVGDLKLMSAHITPMVWAYLPDLDNYRKFPKDLWQKYNQAFDSVWLASAFKGAREAWSDFVPVRHHLDNHLSWLKITTKLQSSGMLKVEGIALTGWSRFDHYAPLCELLPVGIPSLALCLTVLKMGAFNEKLQKEVSKKLGFYTPFEIDIATFDIYTPQLYATYRGAEVYSLMGRFERSLHVKALSDELITAWARPYYAQRNHLSYHQLNASLTALIDSRATMHQISSEAKAVLSKYFDDNTVSEWIQDKLPYQLKGIEQSYKYVKKMLNAYHEIL